jgi:hypothetical protein
MTEGEVYSIKILSEIVSRKTQKSVLPKPPSKEKYICRFFMLPKREIFSQIKEYKSKNELL